MNAESSEGQELIVYRCSNDHRETAQRGAPEPTCPCGLSMKPVAHRSEFRGGARIRYASRPE